MDKKNSVLKNMGIVMNAWVRKSPAALILLLIYIASRLISPFLDSYLSAKAVSSISNGDAKEFITMIALILIAVMVCMGIKNVVGSFLMGQSIYTRLGYFSNKLFSKALYTDYQNVELQKNQKILGKAATSIASNTNGPEELMHQTLNIFVTALGIGTYGAFIFTIDWKVLCVILTMFVFDVLLQNAAIKYDDKHREESSEIWRKKNYIRKKSLEITAGKDIRIYQMQKWFGELFVEIIKRRRDYQMRHELHWYFPTISDVLFNAGRDLLAYSILIKKVIAGDMDVATCTLYIGLISGFSNWIYSLAGNLSNLKRSSHEFNDYFDFLNLPDNNLKGGIKSENGKHAPEIQFKNVGFTYDGAEKATLKNLNFTIKAGEKIALVGNNGAGKTTIVKLLTGLYRHTEGEILVDGISLSEMDMQDYQDNISVLFQETNPLAFTLAENVSSQEEEKFDKEKVMKSLEQAGLLEKVESLKNKEKTFITQNLDDEGILLSGGETQKLLLAKAIYKDGSFLILDEPTSALDPLAESKVYEEYNQMANNKTAVFISHRLASTKFCDKIMFLDNGTIAEYGTHDELMKKGGKYKEMFDIQSQYYS